MTRLKKNKCFCDVCEKRFRSQDKFKNICPDCARNKEKGVVLGTIKHNPPIIVQGDQLTSFQWNIKI